MTDEADTHDETSPLIAPLPDIAGGVAGAAFGLAIAGPDGAIIGGGIGPAVSAALRWGAEALHARRARAGRALQLAADSLDTTPDELGHRAAADPARLELLARVLEAAGRTPFDEKVRALSRVLADGLQQDADVSEALLLATALDELEPPHIRVLQKINGPGAGQDVFVNTRGQPLASISPAVPEYRLLLPALLERLRGQGLVEDVGIPTSEAPAPNGGITYTPPKPRWRPTDLGRRCIELLEDV